MTFPQLAVFDDVALLLLRVMLALVFGASGWSHLKAPRERGESIGLPPAVTALVGGVEVAAAVALVLGVLPQLAALAIVAVMLGAIYKKIFVWGKGFWGEENDGWYYDLFYLVAALVVATVGAGAIALM